MVVTKMHALGDDFCLVEYEPYFDYADFAVKVCDRKLGVGASGLIVVRYEPLEMIYYLNDGSRMPMSANAIRCFSKYCFEKGLGIRNQLEITTGDGKIISEMISNDPFMCKVSLGKPIFNNSMIRVDDILDCFGRRILVNNHYFTIYSLYLSDIETVVFVDDFDIVDEYAKLISKYEIFSSGTNVNFVHVVNKEVIKVMTYDRHNGFVTSGSGAAASVIVSQKLGYTKCNCKASFDNGFLKIEITKKGIVNVTGMANTVFTCKFMEED